MFFYAIFKTLFCVLHPAYLSFKAVKNKDARQFVHWMLYWLTFAAFTIFEFVGDIVLFWLPLYSEAKFIGLLVIRIGSSFVYRKLLHPTLVQNEGAIDDCISRVQQQGFRVAMKLGGRVLCAVFALIVDAFSVATVQDPPPSLEVFSSDSEAEAEDQ